jgi:hypothetical protein
MDEFFGRKAAQYEEESSAEKQAEPVDVGA